MSHEKASLSLSLPPSFLPQLLSLSLGGGHIGGQKKHEHTPSRRSLARSTAPIFYESKPSMKIGARETVSETDRHTDRERAELLDVG